MLPLVRILALLLLPLVAGAESHYWGGQRSLTQIAETTAEKNGNFDVPGGTGFYQRYSNYINANGCLASQGWRPCSMSDVREAYANHVSGWNTIAGGSFGCSWINGYDLSVVTNYDTLAAVAAPNALSTSNCNNWSVTTAGGSGTYGLAFCPPETATGTEFGFALMGCNRTRKLLCCR